MPFWPQRIMSKPLWIHLRCFGMRLGPSNCDKTSMYPFGPLWDTILAPIKIVTKPLWIHLGRFEIPADNHLFVFHEWVTYGRGELVGPSKSKSRRCVFVIFQPENCFSAPGVAKSTRTLEFWKWSKIRGASKSRVRASLKLQPPSKDRQDASRTHQAPSEDRCEAPSGRSGLPNRLLLLTCQHADRWMPRLK